MLYSLREHPVFSAQVPSFTRREKPSAKTSREKISVTSNVSDQSQFTLHIPRSNSRVFFVDLSLTRGENMADDALRKVCEVFGFERLNKHQEKVLRLVFESKSDVFMNLPTGFGKAVVFQALPVVYSNAEPSHEKNMVIVVSPLVNLMRDQVSRLTSLGISAVSLSDICSDDQMRSVEKGSY